MEGVEYKTAEIEAVSSQKGVVKVAGRWFSVSEKVKPYLKGLNKGKARVGISGQEVVYIRQEKNETQEENELSKFNEVVKQETQKSVWEKKDQRIKRLALLNTATNIATKNAELLKSSVETTEVIKIARKLEQYVDEVEE